MEKTLQELLESQVLGEETRTALQEAFAEKLKQAEQKLEESYALRFEHERAVLVETIDTMLNNVIRKELDEFAEDKRSVASQKIKLAEARRQAKKVYEQKLNKNIHLLENFMVTQIAREINEFQDDRKNLSKQRVKMAQELNESRAQTQLAMQDKLNRLENFVIKQLSEEIQEFVTDKKSLVEQRVKLATQAKTKLNETRAQFVNRATSVVDQTLNEVIRKELVQWRDDIRIARENNFGRKIFESVAAEYMSSYLSEGTETKKLQNKLQQVQNKLLETQKTLQQNNKLMEQVQQSARKAEDRAQRVEILNELLTPLRGDKRAVMENLLSDVKTTNLKQAFHRYMPSVLAEQTVVKPRNTQPVSRTVEHNGNRQALVEQTQTVEDNTDLQNILFLAGMSAKTP